MPNTLATALWPTAAAQTVAMVCGGQMEVFIEPIEAAPAVYIFGAGHVGYYLAKIAHETDFGVHVIDDAAKDAALDRIAHGHAVAAQYQRRIGSDRLGRDMLSRIIYGARISLTIGLIGVSVSFVLGIVIGGLAGYYGGIIDNIAQHLIEVVRSIPHVPLWLALSAILPVDWSPLLIYFGITVILGLIDWTGLARAVRSKLLALREEDFCVAAQLMGASPRRIIFRHLLPSFTSHLIASATLAIPSMILGETALSFLGLGLRPPITSWGVLLNEAQNINVVALYPWLMLPVLPVIIVILAFNFFGDGLRDAADPYR